MGEKDRGNGDERGVLRWEEGKMHQLEGKVQQEGEPVEDQRMPLCRLLVASPMLLLS